MSSQGGYLYIVYKTHTSQFLYYSICTLNNKGPVEPDINKYN